jgi:hypothetical protein
MIGFLYRRAIGLKEFGERHKMPWLIRLGLAIRESVLNVSTPKIIISYKTANILDWIFTTMYTALAFWADWRIGLAFIAYDVSKAFEDIKAMAKKRGGIRQ